MTATKGRTSTIPFGPLLSIERVTVHCLRRMIQRYPWYEKEVTTGKVLVKLERLVASSVPVRLKEKHQVKKILTHGCRVAEYRAWLHGNPREAFNELPQNAWILVIENGDTLVSVYENKAQELEFFPST